MKNIYKYLTFLVVFFSLIYYMINREPKVKCESYNRYKTSSFEGIVIKKFIDKNEHSFPFIYIKHFGDTRLEKLNLFNDTDIYNNIRLKDSIIKIKNDPLLYKKNNGSLLKIAIVTYGCKNI